MNPEHQRAAIAEACGWTDVRFIGRGDDTICVGKPKVRPGGINVPDYLNDLNAMHEVEKVLSRGVGYHQPGGFGRYKTLLAEVCGEQRPIDATAAQRAEAFLRTNGKWEESK